MIDKQGEKTSGMVTLSKVTCAIMLAVAATALFSILSAMSAKPAQGYTCSPSHFPTNNTSTTRHTQAASSVKLALPFTNGGIQYKILSRYATPTRQAIGRWDRLGGPVFKEGLGPFARLDLVYEDQYIRNGYAAKWQQRLTRPDNIYYNVWVARGDYIAPSLRSIPQNASLIRRQVNALATHETGHALGLGDHYGNNYKYSSIMYKEPAATCRTVPFRHDINDYNRRW